MRKHPAFSKDLVRWLDEPCFDHVTHTGYIVPQGHYLHRYGCQACMRSLRKAAGLEKSVEQINEERGASPENLERFGL